jgi:hypothetical protein
MILPIEWRSSLKLDGELTVSLKFKSHVPSFLGHYYIASDARISKYFELSGYGPNVLSIAHVSARNHQRRYQVP